jgi:hypothetical protein
VEVMKEAVKEAVKFATAKEADLAEVLMGAVKARVEEARVATVTVAVVRVVEASAALVARAA